MPAPFNHSDTVAIHSNLPPTPGIVACMIVDALDALDDHPDPEVKAWVAAASELLPRDFYNLFSSEGKAAIFHAYIEGKS